MAVALYLRSYFDTVRHHFVLEKVARRVRDDAVLCLLRLLLRASGKQPLTESSWLINGTQRSAPAKEVNRLVNGSNFGELGAAECRR